MVYISWFICSATVDDLFGDADDISSDEEEAKKHADKEEKEDGEEEERTQVIKLS